MMTRHAVLSALMASVALPTAAQQQDPVELDMIILRNTEDAAGPVEGDLNPPTATGSKIPVPLNEVPQSVTVLGEDDLERFNATRVCETLRYSSGLTTDVFGDDADYDWLRIRGFQADQTGVYLDNAQNLAFAFGSFYIDPHSLQRIEVLRGPSSALYGGSNPGGLVNYISKRPHGRIRELGFRIDDAPSAEVFFDIGDDLENGAAYRIAGRVRGGDRYDEFNDGFRGTLAPSLTFSTDDGTEVTLLANLHIADEQHNGSTFLPYVGTVERAPGFGVIDPDANFSDPDWNDYSRRQASVSAIVERGIGNGWTLTGIGRLGVASVEERYYYPFDYSGFVATPSDRQGTLELIAFEHDTLVRTAQTDLRAYGTVQTGPVSHDLLIGLDARYYDLDETQASASGIQSAVEGGGDPGTPTLDPPYRDGKTTQRQIGLYVQDQLRWGEGWIATANLRRDWVRSEQDVDSGFGEAFERDDAETSWRGALAYEFANGMTPYLSLSNSFEARVISPADGVTEPEGARQIEIGFKWISEGGNGALQAAAFRIDAKMWSPERPRLSPSWGRSGRTGSNLMVSTGSRAG